jgi:hypothetical protein
LREHFQGGRDAGSAGRVGEPETSDSPKESINCIRVTNPI